MLLGLNIMGMEAGPSSAGVVKEASRPVPDGVIMAGVVKELGPDGVIMAGGAMGEDGGAPFGTMAGALTGLDIPDWPRTST